MSFQAAHSALSVFPALVILSASTGTGWCGWQTFDRSNGLTDNSVLAIKEDHSETLWFGTQGGVSSFDGATWMAYTTVNGLVSNHVTAIQEDALGSLWFGTDDGVSSFDGVTWRSYTTANGLVHNAINVITMDRAGNLWFGTKGGVSRFDGTTWKTYTTANGLANNWVNAISEDRSGSLWFGTNGFGVSRLEGSTWRTYTTADGLASDFVLAITEDRSATLWFGTSDGVSRLDGNTWKTYRYADGLAGYIVNAISEDPSGDLWFGMSGPGTTRFDGRTWRTYTPVDGLAEFHVQAIIADRSGNLWFGTGAGVSRFDRITWTTYKDSVGLVGHVQAITKDRSGNLWFGTFGQVARFDGATWRTYATSDGFAGGDVQAIAQDSSGYLWFGTLGRGVSRFDGTGWTTYTTSEGLAGDDVRAITADRVGNLWFGTAGAGVSRFDGTTWRTFTTADGLAGNSVFAIAEDRLGFLWFGTNGGVSLLIDSTWTTYTTEDGLASNFVSAITEDSSGNLWFGTNKGASRFDGTWRTYWTGDVAGDDVRAITEDHSGNLWFCTDRGVIRFDGTGWRAYTIKDGLAGDFVVAIREDRSQNLWFGFWEFVGATRYEPDRVAPQTVLLSRPPLLSSARAHSASFVAAFGENDGIEFSHRLDEGPWSPWRSALFWTDPSILDGVHTLQVRSRDYSGNIDPTPALSFFEVDATPPVPLIESPTFGQAVRGTVAVHGTAMDPRFLGYHVDVRPSGVPWPTTILGGSQSQVNQDLLVNWDTTSFPDGSYELMLFVADSLGLRGTAQVSVVVDNHPPYAEVTTPAKISSVRGGDVYTTNAEAHLYFPPRAFADDAVVTMTALLDSLVPANLPSGAVRVFSGYEVRWGGARLAKPARLEFSNLSGTSVEGFQGASSGTRTSAASPTLVMYWSADGAYWERLGGTLTSHGSFEIVITQPGRYVLFAESAVISGTGTLASLAFTPRVFSPTGAFADREVGISFTLGRPAPATVRVYSRSGRLVSEVVVDQPMNAGANVVHWDGRDRQGGFVTDGMYIVTVEALGRTERKTLAVVK